MIRKIGLVALMVGAWMFAGSAMALTPGDISLKNTAKLTYTGNSSGIFAEATVKVNIIAANPTLSAVSDITKAEGQAITTEAQYTVTAANNGKDTYTFTNATLTSGSGLTNVANTNFTGVEYIYKSSTNATISSVTLGVSAFAAPVAANATTITVPSDGVADSEVNGLASGDTVIINSVAYTITGTVTDDGSADVTLGISPVGGGTGLQGGATLPLGTGVYEQQTFTVITNGANGVGAQTTSGAATSYDVTTTLTSTIAVPAAGTATDTFRVTIVNVTITKYVRNLQEGVSGRDTSTGTCATTVSFDPTGAAGAQTYYGNTDLGTGDCVIDARTGDVLEYLIRVVTPADGALALAVISDALPDFTTFVADSTFMNQKNVNDEGDTDNAQTGTATFPLSTDTDNSGLLIQSAATTNDGEGNGTVAASSTVNIVYQTTVL